MVKKYCVRLTEEEQQELKSLVSRGRASAYKQIHARILLLSDENQADGAMKDQEIARVLTVGSATVERVRGVAWRRVWRPHWNAGSNSIAAGISWMAKPGPPDRLGLPCS